MAGKLQAALAWAAKGFRVFPLRENSRFPLDLAWTVVATTDPAVIRAWWIDSVTGFERDLNVGFLCSDHVVLDVDVKNGKQGLATFFGLGLEFGDTLTTRTPSGGYHCIFAGLPDRLVGSRHLVGPRDGVDVKSHNGYVVAPGSTIDGVEYTVEFDAPVAPFPEPLRHLLKAPRRREAAALPPDAEIDAPELVEIVAHWLAHDAEPAVEGCNGDDVTYKIACRIRDYGISEPVAFELFLDEYNPRCSPPWSAAEARQKIENAYRYATGEVGARSPLAAFAHVVPIEPPQRQQLDCDTIIGPVHDLFRFGNAMEEEEIQPRPWVVDGLLMERTVSTLVAPPGAGKSVLSLIVAAHLAVGQDWMRFRVLKAGRSVIYNAEDDREEVSRRLLVVCRLYGLDWRTVRDRICILSSEDIQLQVTENRPPTPKMDHINMLAEVLADPEVVMLSVDPLVEVHTAKENDNPEMNGVMAIFRGLARRTETPVLVVQHTGKQPTDKVSMAGSLDAGRGASSIPGAARISVTAYPATDAECVDLGVPTTHRRRYVRIDNAKTQYSAPPEGGDWMRWESRTIASGDEVGVLVPHSVNDSRSSAAANIASQLVSHMMRAGTASILVEEAVTILATADPMAVPEDREKVKRRLLGALEVPRSVGETTISLSTLVEGSRKTTRVVMG